MAEITAKQVKGGCINAIREGKCYTFLLILGTKQNLLVQCYNLQKICIHQFKIHI
jgi:hypothetical protein